MVRKIPFFPVSKLLVLGIWSGAVLGISKYCFYWEERVER